MEMTRIVTIKLSREEVAKIIKEYLSEEGFVVDEDNIYFNVEAVWYGYGQDEYSEKEFTGCTVTGNMKTERNNK